MSSSVALEQALSACRIGDTAPAAVAIQPLGIASQTRPASSNRLISPRLRTADFQYAGKSAFDGHREHSHVAKRRHLSTSTDKSEHFSVSTSLSRDRLGRGRQARLLVALDVDLAVDHPAAELQELGPEPLAAPALQGVFRKLGLLWQIVQFVAGATPARVRFPQHAPCEQVVDVAQARVR